MKQTWTNKIVGHANVDPKTLLANDKNFRLHSKLQRLALAGAIKDVGFIRSVTVNKRTDRIIDGHLRVSLALEQEQLSVPVEYVDLTEAEEAEALATLDPLAELAETDQQKWSALMADIHTSDPNLQQVLEGFCAIEAQASQTLTSLTIPAEDGADEHGELYVLGDFDATTAPPVIAFGRKRLTITHPEMARFQSLLDQYVERNKTEIGFLSWLFSFLKD